MAEERKLFGKVEIVWSRSTTLLKVLVILLIVFSTAAMIALNWVRISIHNQAEAVRAESAAIEERNQVLQDRIDDPDSVGTIQEIAEEELGLVNPDTILIKTE